jgi:hypothetical protein
MFLRVVLGCAVLALLLPIDAAALQPADTSPLAAELSRAIQSHQFGIFDDVIVDVQGDAAVLTGRVTSQEKRVRPPRLGGSRRALGPQRHPGAACFGRRR